MSRNTEYSPTCCCPSVSLSNLFFFVSRYVDWCVGTPVWVPWRRHVSLPIISTVQIDVFLLLFWGGGGGWGWQNCLKYSI